MNKTQIETKILGLSYPETILFFKSICTKEEPYSFRPIKIDNIDLWIDNEKDLYRCNVIISNYTIIKIDGWY